MKPSATRVALRYLQAMAYNPEADYYSWTAGTPLQTVIDRWQKQRPGTKERYRGGPLDPLPRQRVYDDSMPAFLSPKLLWPHREYTWTRDNARGGFAKVDAKSIYLDGPLKWDALAKDMKSRGWDPREPLLFEIGLKGGVKVGEGNHRLAIAMAVGLSRIPVEFHFLSGRAQKQPQPARGVVVEVPAKAVKQVVQEQARRPQKKLSPEEQAKQDRQVEEIMRLLNF